MSASPELTVAHAKRSLPRCEHCAMLVWSFWSVVFQRGALTQSWTVCDVCARDACLRGLDGWPTEGTAARRKTTS